MELARALPVRPTVPPLPSLSLPSRSVPAVPAPRPPAAGRGLLTTRRAVLASASAGALVALSAGATGTRAVATAGPLRSDPFTLGVASGDPWPDGFVIWTRLAPEPLAEDGLGGTPARRHPVQWQVAADEAFRDVVRRGRVESAPQRAHAVHVDVTGLRPGREYFYRFRVDGWISPTGRALTAPDPGSMPQALAMSFVSCSQLEHGWFTAYRRMAEDRPDLVVHLGDYTYEYPAFVSRAASGNVRHHDGPETVTLADYRRRYAQYKTDPDLQLAHATAPWLVIWDDHEVENNWADEVPEEESTPLGFRQRREAAFRAYYEHLPLRRSSVPRGLDLQLYRRLHWGRLASFHLLDTRQYRDDQVCGDGEKACPEADAEHRSITGDEQERWLLDGFRRSRARWDLLAQQVFFSRVDVDPGPETVVSMDTWNGYVASRRRVTQGWLDAGVRNPVVLTGDVHDHWAAEIEADFSRPTGKPVGTELVCSSITSGGDGEDNARGTHPAFAENPHLKFFNDQRGYVRTTIRPDRMDVDFRTLARVSLPGAEAVTRRSYAVEDRDPTLHQTSDRPPV
jgi:alkaline phosphatase D